MKELNGKQQYSSIELLFNKKDILYDVANYSFVEGDIAETENEHRKHHIFDIAEDGNIDRVTRMINLAYSECIEMLYPYTKKKAATGLILNSQLSAPLEYRITMSVPTGFSATTIQLLRDMIHEYFVSRVLEDWFSIVKPESQINWRSKLEELKTKIQSILISRMNVRRRRMCPF